MTYHAQGLFIGDKPLEVSVSTHCGAPGRFVPFTIEADTGDKITIFCPAEPRVVLANADAFGRLAYLLRKAADGQAQEPEEVTTEETRESVLGAIEDGADDEIIHAG